jgi:hypothetical protein
MKTYLSIANRLPPPLCRLVARVGRRGMTDGAIAERSGLSIQKVVWISCQPDWSTVTVGDMAAFMTGCGVGPENLRHHLRFLRRTAKSANPLSHLRIPEGSTLRLLASLPEGATPPG